MGRVEIRWTETAKQALAALPPKVRRGLIDKAGELRNATDPAAVYKPLRGPLAGYFRIPYSRYRAIFTVQASDTSTTIVVLFVAAGVRKQGDKKDIYRLAEKLMELGIIEPAPSARKNNPDPTSARSRRLSIGQIPPALYLLPHDMALAEPLRILSDIHFHHPASFAREAGQLAPLLEGVKTVVFNGDTTELRFTKLRNLGLASCQRLRELCAERSIEAIFINGNHDPVLSPISHLDLAQGAVVVTHGDVLFQDISPWSDESPVLLEAHLAELAKLPPEAFTDLEKRLAAVKQACMVFETHRSTLKSGLAGMIQSYAREAWPPWRPLRVIGAWRQLPRRAVAMGRVFRPRARCIIVGHTHYAGVWRRGPRTVINTGSFMPHGGSYLVDLQDSQIAVRRINRRSGAFHPGKLIAELPISKLTLEEGY